uniref:DUF104 domain-containing protein n=1 Tax=Schlesneria paludicola TaxID=360056 RepID=A0A7C2P5H5_9PLAN
MIRATGRVRGNVVELLQPCDLEDGALVEVEIRPLSEDEEWKSASLSRLEEVWDNPEDAVYDNWKQLYGVQPG